MTITNRSAWRLAICSTSLRATTTCSAATAIDGACGSPLSTWLTKSRCTTSCRRSVARTTSPRAPKAWNSASTSSDAHPESSLAPNHSECPAQRWHDKAQLLPHSGRLLHQERVPSEAQCASTGRPKALLLLRATLNSVSQRLHESAYAAVHECVGESREYANIDAGVLANYDGFHTSSRVLTAALNLLQCYFAVHEIPGRLAFMQFVQVRPSPVCNRERTAGPDERNPNRVRQRERAVSGALFRLSCSEVLPFSNASRTGRKSISVSACHTPSIRTSWNLA